MTSRLLEGYNRQKASHEKMVNEHHDTDQRTRLVAEIIGTLNLRFKNLNLYYEAAWTDSFCHRRCMHEHQTLIEAAQCAAPHGAGWYVIATENGAPRQLDGLEEDVVNEFRFGKASRNAWKRLFRS